MRNVTCDSWSLPVGSHGMLNIKNNRKTKIIAAAEYALTVDEDEIEEEEKNWMHLPKFIALHKSFK